MPRCGGLVIRSHRKNGEQQQNKRPPRGNGGGKSLNPSVFITGGKSKAKPLHHGIRITLQLAGLSLIIAGAVVQTRFKAYLDFFGTAFSAVAILLIIIGCIIFVIGFFGCCGAYKEQYCMVMTFAVLLGLIFILEISAGIAAYAMRDKIQTRTKTILEDSVQNYQMEGHTGVTRTWNALQHDFRCCGVEDYKTWSGLNGTLPDSCCKEETEGCGKNPGYPSGSILNTKYWDDGCIKGFEGFIQKNILLIGGVGIGFAFVQIVGIILSCCLARAIRREYEVV